MDKTLKGEIVSRLARAKKHLQYSHNKVIRIPLDGGDLSEEQLETMESFASRFARYSDIVIMKYFRILATEKDPAFRGSVIDLLNMGEKFGWIDSAQTWRRIRELRNVASHDYEMDDYKKLYAELIGLTPDLLKIALDL